MFLVRAVAYDIPRLPLSFCVVYVFVCFWEHHHLSVFHFAQLVERPSSPLYLSRVPVLGLFDK